MEQISVGQRLSMEGDDLAAAGQLEEALNKYDEALRADVDAHGESHPDVAMRYCSMGGLYRIVGDAEMAHDYFSKALEVEQASGTAGSRIALASYLSNVAGIQRAMDNLDAALDAYVRALEHLRGVLPPDVPQAIAEEEAALMRTMDTAAAAAGEVPSSSSSLSSSAARRVEGRLKVLGENGVLDSAASVLNNLGLLMKAKGEPRCAYRLYLRAISLGVVTLGEHHPTIALRIRNLGAVLLGLGHSEMATERLEQAHRMCVLGYGDDHPETVACADWLDAARKGAGAGDLAQEVSAAAPLPDVAEWFVRELDCGVLEPPPPSQTLPGDDNDKNGAAVPAVPVPAAAAAAAAAVPVVASPAAAAAAVAADELPLVSVAEPRSSSATAPATTAAAAAATPLELSRPPALALALAPLEPAAGEDLLSPYAEPQTAVVGGDGGALVWRSVADERADIVSNGAAMPVNQDYIAEYVKQAPGYVNLITPFSQMPSELLMPYSDYRGYGVPRVAAAEGGVEVNGRNSGKAGRVGYHEPRVHSPAGYNKTKAEALGYLPVPRMGLGADSGDIEALIAAERNGRGGGGGGGGGVGGGDGAEEDAVREEEEVAAAAGDGDAGALPIEAEDPE